MILTPFETSTRGWAARALCAGFTALAAYYLFACFTWGPTRAREGRKEGRKEGLLGSEQYSAPPLLPIATRHHTSTLASPLQGRREGGTASWRSTFAAEVAPDSGVIYILSLENRGPCHHRSALLGRVPGSSSAAGHSPALGVS